MSLIEGKEMTLDGSNVGFHKERVEAWARGERVPPVFMDIAWTRKCQAACHFCYAQAQASEGGEIKWEHAQAFLQDAAEIGVLAMNYISDGESTMVPWYADSVELAAKLGIRVGAGTNGISTPARILERILPHLMSFRVNFSAGERKRYAEIMGLKQAVYDVVLQNIQNAVRLVRDNKWPCIVNMNLVLDPVRDADQILPFARLARELGVHYAIIKHCAVDPDGVLDVDYTAYNRVEGDLKAAEELSNDQTKIIIKWQKILKAGKREHTSCYGPPFALQMSGNGLIAPCGPLFNEKYRAFHIGNITQQRFLEMFHSERYWEVMNYLGSDQFNPQERCPSDCMQRLHNDWLFAFKKGQVTFPIHPAPANVEFLA